MRHLLAMAVSMRTPRTLKKRQHPMVAMMNHQFHSWFCYRRDAHICLLFWILFLHLLLLILPLLLPLLLLPPAE